MRFKLLTDEDDILVLRLVREKETKTQIDESSLLLQQQALKNIWDSEEEDVYEQKIEIEFGSLGIMD